MTKRPPSVHETAKYDAEKKLWIDARDDHRCVWHPEGDMLLDAECRGGELHGHVVWQNTGKGNTDVAVVADELAKDLGLPDGPPLTEHLEATYDNGQLRRTKIFDRNDVLLVDAHWKDGELDGPFHWNIGMQINFGSHVIAYGARTLMPRDFKPPKPHPKTVDVTFKNGKLVKPKKPAPGTESIAEFGQGLAQSDLTGYIARGELARDLAAFFPAANRQKPGRGRALKTWIDALPAAHRDAAKAFDGLVHSGTFPALPETCDVGTYGFDTVTNELDGLTDARYVGLSSDGSGNMHMLDIMNGKVVGYEHEESMLDPRRAFDSLDAYAFAMIRVEAAAQDRIDRKALAGLFKKLGLAAGTFELELHP